MFSENSITTNYPSDLLAHCTTLLIDLTRGKRLQILSENEGAQRGYITGTDIQGVCSTSASNGTTSYHRGTTRSAFVNPRPVGTMKTVTGRIRMRLWLVARRDRSWLWRPLLDLQRAPAFRAHQNLTYFVKVNHIPEAESRTVIVRNQGHQYTSRIPR